MLIASLKRRIAFLYQRYNWYVATTHVVFMMFMLLMLFYLAGMLIVTLTYGEGSVSPVFVNIANCGCSLVMLGSVVSNLNAIPYIRDIVSSQRTQHVIKKPLVNDISRANIPHHDVNGDLEHPIVLGTTQHKEYVVIVQP